MPWATRALKLYHGTILPHADDIAKNGIQLAHCAPVADFGPGFYMTRLYDQAVTFANQRYDAQLEAHARHPGTYFAPEHGAVIEFSITLNELGTLDTLAFVQPVSDWLEFVRYCRLPSPAHKLSGKFYEAVYGPCWASGSGAIPDWEQVSLHSDKAVSLLKVQDIRRGSPMAS
jgi:Protein of unknown function (DUF3990)